MGVRYTWLCASLYSVLCHAYLHEMSFPVNFTYIKNYTLANIPTKLIYKHRVDYYEYTTVLYSIHTATYQNGFAHRTLHVGRGVQAPDKRTLGKVPASGNAHRDKFTRQENKRRERFTHWERMLGQDERQEMHIRWMLGEGFTHLDQCVTQTVSFSATIEINCKSEKLYTLCSLLYPLNKSLQLYTYTNAISHSPTCMHAHASP